jgi:recombination protein RecT
MTDNNQETQITQRDTKVISFSQSKQNALDSQLQAILPKHIDKEFFKKSFGITLASNPKFEQCDQKSLNMAICRCAEIGVLPNGKQAVLIPYGRDVQYQIMVNGFIEILDKAGVRVNADNVFSNDVYKETSGCTPWIDHEINRKEPRGEYVGTYAVFFDKTTKAVVGQEFVSKEDMCVIKSKSQNSKAWVEFEDEMRKKSAIKRGAKRISLSPIVDKAIEQDNEINGFKREEIDVTPKVSSEPKNLLKKLGINGLKMASEIEPPVKPSDKSLDEIIEEEDNQK